MSATTLEAPAADQDRELLALCADLERLHATRLEILDQEPIRREDPAAWAAWNKQEDDIAEAYHGTLDRITEMKPATAAGLIAKAKATVFGIRAHEENTSGEMNMDNHFELAFALAENCIALAGGAA